VEELEGSGLLGGVRPYAFRVGHCDRCGAVIEPWLSEQWWCWIWAFFDPETMAKELHTSVMQGDRYEYVSGIIGAGGDIVEHDLGFRAQYAKVLGIFSDEWPTPKVEIAESYDCQVILPEDYDAFCYEHDLVRLDWQ